MPEAYRIKIDLNKVLDQYLFNSQKTGAQYLDLTMWPSEKSNYGDSHTIRQDLGREARDKGIKSQIIGNAKLIERKAQGSPVTVRWPAPAPQAPDDSDVPY